MASSSADEGGTPSRPTTLRGWTPTRHVRVCCGSSAPTRRWSAARPFSIYDSCGSLTPLPPPVVASRTLVGSATPSAASGQDSSACGVILFLLFGVRFCYFADFFFFVCGGTFYFMAFGPGIALRGMGLFRSEGRSQISVCGETFFFFFWFAAHVFCAPAVRVKD